MSLASFMQDADAHHRRRRIESSSVPRFPAILSRGGSSASSSSDSSSDQDAGDGDYKEPSAGNTPRRRSATPSRAVSPAAPRQQALRKSKLPASPSSSRASKQDDSDDSSGEQSSAPCLSDSNRGEQLATPNAGKQAGCKRKRAPSTRYSENKQLPPWKSDQPTGVLRAPAKPMVQPQLAAPSAEPALKLVHGDNDWMQGRGPQGLITLGWIMPVKGKPKPLGHWTEKVLRITPRCPLAGFKADSVANQGSVREKAILGNGVVHVCFHPKDPNEASKGVCGRTWSTPVKPTKSRMLSLSPLRTLLPRVTTSNRARHELIQLPTIIKVRLLGTRRQSGTVPVPVPDLAGDGDAPPSPSPICPESGTLPRPRFPSGGPRIPRPALNLTPVRYTVFGTHVP